MIERSTSPTPTLQQIFPYESLRVYQQSIGFVAWCEQLTEKLPKPLTALTELERELTFIPLKLAEGSAQASPAKRLESLEAARSAALHCAACLDVLVAKKRLLAGQVISGKKQLADLIATLVIHIDDIAHTELAQAPAATPPSES